jgi:hypothetical protein
MYLVSFAFTAAGGRPQRDPNLAALKDRFQASWSPISERL